MTKKTLPITIKDFERIFRIVRTVSTSLNNIPGKSCLFYNAIGSLILEKKLKIKASPVMGAAFIKIHNEPEAILSYGNLNNDNLSSDSDAFHCWVQCEDFVIDFTSPEYHESLLHSGNNYTIQRKMFQKDLSLMSNSCMDITRNGDFYFEPNKALTHELLKNSMELPAMSDLADICLHWYKKSPKKLRTKFSMMNDLNEVTHMKLTDIRISDAW